jgi:hypothetical protein
MPIETDDFSLACSWLHGEVEAEKKKEESLAKHCRHVSQQDSHEKPNGFSVLKMWLGSG